MNRAYYSSSIENFISKSVEEILGTLSDNNDFTLELTQKESWKYQIISLQKILTHFKGSIYFEYAIPRMGKRIDVLLIINSIIFVLEYKVGEEEYHSHAIDQVWDYALDLKNFHETSHDKIIIPILVATHAKTADIAVYSTLETDTLLNPSKTNNESLAVIINSALLLFDGNGKRGVIIPLQQLLKLQWHCIITTRLKIFQEAMPALLISARLLKKFPKSSKIQKTVRKKQFVLLQVFPGQEKLW